MSRPAPLVALLLLAGCAGALPPASAPVGRGAVPAQVILYRDTATVRFSDGALCTAVRPGRALRWSGTLGGCPHAWPYEVARPAPRAAPRQPLTPGSGGDVVLTSPDGTRTGYGTATPEA
ncbi:hypothetical protein LCGC14_2980440 [marine sediment metagenome]|uniref:Uncharacterized protein n=1 Tax=marine sediment metagenome TaxID=412755 RepID=A0A0F8ZXY5_9ZZZZ